LANMAVQCSPDTFVVKIGTFAKPDWITLPTSLKDDIAKMNDRNKYKQVSGQMNHQTADPSQNQKRHFSLLK
jgi:hypothetical protein